MTDICEDLAGYLNASTDPNFAWLTRSSETPGTTGTLFTHSLPPIPDSVAVIQKYEGAAPTETFGNPFSIRHPRIQVLVRDPDSLQALNRAEQIMKFFGVIKDQVINGTEYSRVRAVGEPFEIGPDSSDREQAVVNFEVSFYD